MRGHGSVVVGSSIKQSVFRAIYTENNARLQMQAAPLGEYFPVPNGFNLTGIAKDSLLSTETTWLQDGLDNLAKAKKETEAALGRLR